MGKLQPYLMWVFRAAVIVYALIAGYFFLNRPAGSGDEDLFIGDLQYIQSEGWWAAIVKGISLPYMLLSYLPAQLFEPHVALRLINVLLLLGLVGYFYYIRSIKKIDFYLMLLFFVSTVGYFYSGINDTLLITSSVVFFTETYILAFKTEKRTLVLWGTALVVMLFTRALGFVFLPVILVSVYLVLKKGVFNKKTLLVPVALLLVMLALNMPSILANQSLSYDAKDPPKEVDVTWAQRQYYAQLLVNEGKIENHKHPSWQETQDYLDAKGADALPAGIVSGVLFDPTLTVKEFFKDLAEIGIYGTRQIGLVLPIMLFFGGIYFFRERKLTENTYLPFLLLSMICIFALLIISYVELRWLGSVFILAIFGFWQLEQQGKFPKIVVLANYSFLILLSLYGLYGLYSKIVSG